MIYHKTARPDWTRIAPKAILESAQTAPLHGPEQIYEYGQSSGLIERLFEDITRQNADAEYYEDEDYVVRWKRQDDQAVKIRVIDKATEFKRVKLVLSYDGRFFRGFQVQPNVRTVAGVLEEQISLVNDYRTRVHGASRTDEGVHALGQVAHFDTHHDFDEERWRVILNHSLPYDVHVLDVAFVPFSFHARYSVVHKVYQYVLNTGEYEPTRGHYEWTIPPSTKQNCVKSYPNSLAPTISLRFVPKGKNRP
ncbi:MAG: tRNA pseudouridine(38-40) synthase TruA [Bacillus subtilis]|nr:tRNA pseudouridine(38-40) synthase TruA [Bacillus subtilis]